MATTTKKTSANGTSTPAPAAPQPGNRIITLDEFIIRSEKDFDYATGELTGLLRDIGVAAKIINREVNKAGLVNILGVADSGECLGRHPAETRCVRQRQIDRMPAKLRRMLRHRVRGKRRHHQVPASVPNKSHYVVMFDPLGRLVQY
jgi:fructose-1,6-bisphosphatase I